MTANEIVVVPDKCSGQAVTRRLTSRVAIVTGAARGIGHATAWRLAAEGAKLVVNDHDGLRLERNIAALPGAGHRYQVGDISREATARELADLAIREFGRIDILVNNAGVYAFGDVTETTEADIDRVLGINVKGAIWCCKHVIPTMVTQHRGSIVNLSSVSSFTGHENEGLSTYLYSISKAAMGQLAVSLATRHGKRRNPRKRRLSGHRVDRNSRADLPGLVGCRATRGDLRRDRVDDVGRPAERSERDRGRDRISGLG